MNKQRTNPLVGLIHHPLFEKHLEGHPHVERPERVTAILNRLRSSSLAPKIVFLEAAAAERKWIELVHDPDYVNGILTLDIKDAVFLDSGDTVATSATPLAALHAAGAGIQAAKLVLDGSFRSAFCAVRPPGHHAERDRAMGFCIFNNIAVAASYLLTECRLNRVAIVDFDIHHGNGTERTFIEDNRVLFISLHQYPHYPGTGSADMTGLGAGAGFTLNLPMSSGAGDPEYAEAFQSRVIPALDRFKPEFLLVSAGFDGHADDPLAETLLSSAMFGTMTRQLRVVAEHHCRGRIVSMLEGGYDLNALAGSVEEHLKALVD
jgi:acetoin utilization deacetylase AcuC-like enzyme